jgi:hypothetical protein
MTKVERKMASSETTRVSVGQGLLSKKIIQTAKIAMCRYTKCIDPAYAVIRSAIRFWRY